MAGSGNAQADPLPSPLYVIADVDALTHAGWDAPAFVGACADAGVGFRFHSGETAVGSAAYLQLSAALPWLDDPAQTLFRWYADDVIEGGPFVPRDGVVPVPTGPGLGVRLDSAALARCHQRYLDEGLFPPAVGKESYADHFVRR